MLADYTDYDTPHFWLEATIKRGTRVHDWVVRDYMVKRLVKRAEAIGDDGRNPYEIKADAEVFLDKLGPSKEQRCFEMAVPDALRALAERYPEDYDEILADKFMWYATEDERLGRK